MAPAKQAHFRAGEGWHDLVLPIGKYAFDADGTCRIHAVGTLDGTPIGIEISVAAGLQPGIVDGEIDRTAFGHGAIGLRGIGAPTRALLECLASRYGVTVPEGALRGTLALDSFALEGDPSALQREHVNFKVFHDANEERGQYWEMYLHVDIARLRIELHEKDPEYRSAIIRSFFE